MSIWRDTASSTAVCRFAADLRAFSRSPLPTCTSAHHILLGAHRHLTALRSE